MDADQFTFSLSQQVVEYAYKNSIATVNPEPTDIEAFVRSHLYSTDYDGFTFDNYSWPEEAMKVQTVQL
ncbi:MAON protein, partial [Polyodon spathula]|nr:MAON protein [Polyodon spathula]